MKNGATLRKKVFAVVIYGCENLFDGLILEYFDYISTYSPYENIRKDIQYPNGRITAGLWDPRVAYWEPTKWVAKMREFNVTHGCDPKNTSPSKLIYECQMNAGHFASTVINTVSLILSFLIFDISLDRGDTII